MKKIIALLGITGIALSAGAVQAQTSQNTPNEPFLLAQSGGTTIVPTERYSYIGVAGNVGLSNRDRGVADDGVAAISKIALTDNVSFRPGVNFGGDTVVTLPVTYDFSTRDGRVTPYIGAGIVTGDGDTDFLATGGLDYRFSRDFVGNIGTNVGFGDRTDVGLTLGVGYAIPHSR
ncbi:hypothetical protein NIES970_19600 [[Synechococcus] sp. NIES-970]|uniref:hypothetical protein n=1 Tax=Picosynechococcus sp. NKBG15041c TaxID=1407650 RepID=UPI00041087BF|nr:hypothetical protein [Picosynechococcus sp. NKBG15041c]BAW97016.1 hypothetical protein NIES970_19600 [[Synechococcus] sp. NIES-970]